jgi:hypothetical protein
VGFSCAHTAGSTVRGESVTRISYLATDKAAECKKIRVINSLNGTADGDAGVPLGLVLKYYRERRRER